jgi:hypothetical protein
MKSGAVALNGQQKPSVGRQERGEGVKVPIDEIIDRQPNPYLNARPSFAPTEVVTPEA